MLCRNVLITGANRGIGLELVKQFAKQNLAGNIFATCRSPESAKDLNGLAERYAAIKILKLDVCNMDSIKDLATIVTEIIGSADGLNLLINNAGIYSRDSDDVEKFKDVLFTNTIAPYMLTKALLPIIKEAANKESGSGYTINKAAIINMTSSVASIAENLRGGNCFYRASKAGLNAITKSFSIDLKDDKILVTSVHPGSVQTDMGGPNAFITPEVCVSGMLETFASMNETHNGAFVRYDGTTIQW